MWKDLVDLLKRLCDSAIKVGDPKRVRRPDEPDQDEERLGSLNKIWTKMVDDDPWMPRLRANIKWMLRYSFGVVAGYFLLGAIAPSNHWAFDLTVALVVVGIWYWFKIGRWYNEIQTRAFEKFKKKFGKHFHLK